MASNFPKEFIIIILCIMLIFISVLLMPRYLSKQYFQLRNELDSEGGNLKYSQKENLKHYETLLKSQNSTEYTSRTIRSVIKAENVHEDSSHTINKFKNASAKVKKRSKRHALSDKDKIFSWNFSLNVFSQQNVNSQETVKNVSDALDQNNFMGVSLSAKGKGKQYTTLAELQNALSSAKRFINNLIFKTEQNVTRENVKFSPDKVAFGILSEEQTLNPDIVKFESDGSGDEPINSRRQPKFIFGLFGMGKKSIESTTNFERETLITTKRATEMEVLKVPEVLLESTQLPKTENNLENDLETPSHQTETLVMQTNNIETDSDEMVNNAEFSLIGMTEHDGPDNTTDDFESLALKSETDSQEKTSEATINLSKPLFTDSVLELYCMSLLTKVEESQHSFDSDEVNSLDVQHNKQNEPNPLRPSQNSSLLNLLNTFNSIQKESAQGPDVIEDFVSTSNEELVTEIELLRQRESRFVDFGSIFGFGSGRSAISDESNNLENEDVITLENSPSRLDCENYFRKKDSIKMFPKPNLVDMISNPKIQLVDFANATMSPNLREQNFQFLTDLLKTSLNSTVDTFSKNSEDANVAKLNTEKDLTTNKDVTNVDTVKIMNGTESSDSQLSKSASTSMNGKEVLHTTESQRSGKFLNIFGFGSGFFGSGMRSLETIDSTESDSIEEFGSGEQFKKSDVQLRNFGEDVSKERFLGFLGFGGSGEGRELAEDKKTTATGISCNQDCIQVSTEKSSDCDDDACRLENPLEHNGFGNFEDAILRNESNCEEDCFTNNMDDSKTENTLKNIAVGQILNESKNLEEHPYHNCSCYHKTNDENVTFFECDECNFEDMQRKGEFRASLSQQSVVLRNASEVKFQDDYENGCYNCNPGEELPDKNVNFTNKNMSFTECDECEFNGVNAQIDESAKEKSVKNNGIGHNITFQECDECSFSAQNKQMHENTEKLSYEDFLSKDSSTMSFDYGIDCNDCNDTHIKQSNDTILYLDNVNESGVHTRLINMDTTDRVKLNESTYVDTINEGVQSFTDVNQIQNVVNEHTTEMQSRRFMSTIFLTGSGDGGLFGDSVGPINLIEEESTVATPGFSQKRGRAKDTLTYPTEIWNESNLKESNHEDLPKYTTNVPQISTLVSPNVRPQRRGRLNDIPPNSFDNLDGNNQENLNILKDKTNITGEEIATVPEDFSPRRGKLDDGNFDCDDCDLDLAEIMHERNLNSSTINQVTSTTSTTSKHFEVGEKMFSSISPDRKSDITNIRKTTEQLPLDTFTSGIPVPTNLPPRSCRSASECNGTLNERCITVNSSPICTCGRAYVRHKETKKCIAKRIVNTSMKLPAEKFDKDLKDPSSQRHKEMKKFAANWMSSLLSNTPKLWSVLSHIEVVKFSPGSLVVNWNIVFAVENESEEKLIKDVSGSIQNALQNESLRQESPLNVSHASLISVNSVDPCKAGQLNECYCEWKSVPEGFTCHCSEQFRDISTYSHHIEETCQESCSPDYCSFNGHCEVIDDKRVCLCSGLYFGRRCDVPGLFVLIILGIIAAISVFLLLILIFRRKCRTRRSSRGLQTFRRSQEIGTITQTHDRVSDIIAMEENVGATVSKFVPITTPTQPPVIKVIRPTVSESIASFEYDCQFDSPAYEAVPRSENSTV